MKKLKVSEAILSIAPYVPGKPMAALERELGVVNSVKLASNENPIGSSPLALEALQTALGDLNRYPDGGGYDLVHKLSQKLGHALKHFVARWMPVGVVHFLKMIDVKKKNAHVLLKSRALIEQALPAFKEGVSAKQARQVIDVASLLEFSEGQEHLVKAVLKRGYFTVEV